MRDYMAEQIQEITDPIYDRLRSYYDKSNHMNCYIAGVPHAKPDLSVLKIGDIVSIVPEPTNAFDPNALLVNSPAGAKLGYVPRALTPIFKSNNVKTATIVGFTTTKWHEVEIEFETL